MFYINSNSYLLLNCFLFRTARTLHKLITRFILSINCLGLWM